MNDMRLILSFFFIFFHLTLAQIIAGEKTNNPLSLINNYKQFFLKSCAIIHDSNTT